MPPTNKDDEPDGKKMFPLSNNTYLEQLHSLWVNKSLCDAKVVAEGRHFQVHRVVLAAASKYFERIFSSESWIESKTGVVELEEVTALSLEIILKSVYTQELQLSPEIVLGVLEAAHRLEFTEVFKCCEKYIEDIISPPNCLVFLKAGETYGMNKVLQSAEKCLLDHFTVVSLQDSFLQMDGDALKQYVKNKNLQCDSELDVFQAVVRWIKHASNRQDKATMMMRHVRFGLMSSSNLLGEVWKEPMMTTNKQCQEMLRKAIEYTSNTNERPFFEEEWCTPRNTRQWLVVIGGSWDPTRNMTPPVVLPFDDPKREVWSIDNDLKPLSNTYQEGGTGVEISHYLFILGGIHSYPASSNDASHEAHHNSHGRITVSNTVWRFNSVELYCEQMTNMLVARKYHTAFLNKDTIIVAGGKNDAKRSLSSTEVYNVTENSWDLGPYLPHGLLHLAGCSMKDQAYLSGGLLIKKQKYQSSKKLFKHDTILKEWIEKAAMHRDRCEHSMACTEEGLFVVGGMSVYRHDNDPYTAYHRHVYHPEMYNSSTNQWTVIQLDIKVANASTIVKHEKIYLLGGCIYDENDADFMKADITKLGSIKCMNTKTMSVEKMKYKLPFRISDSVMALLNLPARRDEGFDSNDPDNDFVDDEEGFNRSYEGSYDGQGASDNNENNSEDSYHSDEEEEKDAHEGEEEEEGEEGYTPQHSSEEDAEYSSIEEDYL